MLRLGLTLVVLGFALTVLGWIVPAAVLLLLAGAFCTAISMESMIPTNVSAPAEQSIPITEPNPPEHLRRAA